MDTADVRPGQRVLIHAGRRRGRPPGGPVRQGPRRPRDRHRQRGQTRLARSLGADELIDYTAVRFAEAVADVDVVLDLVGGPVGRQSIDILRPGGLLLTIVDHTDTALRAATIDAGRRFAGITVEPDHTSLEALAALTDTGKLRPTSSTPSHWTTPPRHMNSRGRPDAGKVVLVV